MRWIQSLRRASAVDVAAAMTKLLADVGDAVKCLRTGNGAEFTNEMFATIWRDKTIRHEYTGVNGLKHNGVVERGLDLIQEGGVAAFIEPPRLFPGHLPDFVRFRVEAAIYMNSYLNTTATTANAGCKSPYSVYFGKLPPANTLTFMQPGFRRVQRANRLQLKVERCFCLNRERNHPRDSVKVLTSSGLTSDTQDVAWEMERVLIIAAGLDTGTAAEPEAWEAGWHVWYVPPVSQI